MLNKQRLFSISSLAVLLACGFACAQETTKEGSTKPAETNAADQIKATDAAKSDTITKEDITKASEAFGHFIGRNLKAPGINFDLEAIIKGMREGAAGKPSPMSDKDYEELMSKIQEQAYTKLAAENLKAANEFMAKNGKEANIVAIEPGKLEYVTIQEGTGAAVAEHSAPLIKYSGKYLDGTVFGSSDESGGPISLPLDQTIPGIIKGVVGMKEGEKRKIFIHPDMGYGTAGQLPPNSLLIFEVEVIKADSPNLSADADDDMVDFDDDLAESDTDDDDDRFYDEDMDDDEDDDDTSRPAKI